MRLSKRNGIPPAVTSLAIWALIGIASPLVLPTGAAGTGTPADLCTGVWTALADVQAYHWQLWTTDNGGLAGVVHVMEGDRKESEVPIARAEWQPPELVMHVDATGVDYRGTVDAAAGTIEGALYRNGRRLQAMNLRRTDPEDIAGLSARPRNAGPWSYAVPPALGDGWETGDCADAGLGHEAVGGMVAAVESGEAGVLHSLLIVAGGKLVVEEYFHGFGLGDTHRLASTTKSVSALLVGLAIDAGKIADVDAPLLSYFPDLRPGDDPRWREETLEHVLAMSMGLDWGADDPHGTGPEFFQQVLARPIVHDPGTHWAYQSANVDLLAGVLKQATGMHADAWAQERLFGPLGITAWDWNGMAVGGYRLMDGSLRLRPRDMAKLGMLLRDEGRWQGRQVVSADWIARMIAPRMDTGAGNQYGYLWWIGEAPRPDGPLKFVMARGRGSQFVIWVPEQDLIVVTTGGNDDNGMGYRVLRVLAQHL